LAVAVLLALAETELVVDGVSDLSHIKACLFRTQRAGETERIGIYVLFCVDKTTAINRQRGRGSSTNAFLAAGSFTTSKPMASVSAATEAVSPV